MFVMKVEVGQNVSLCTFVIQLSTSETTTFKTF